MDLIHIWQFEKGSQGAVSEQGTLLTEIVPVQLLECYSFGLVSSTPRVRIAKCALVNGELREIRFEKYFSYDSPQPCVALRSSEPLPSGDNWTPTPED